MVPRDVQRVSREGNENACYFFVVHAYMFYFSGIVLPATRRSHYDQLSHAFSPTFLAKQNRYKMVDSRMKKELRATKRIAKKAKGSNRRK